MGAPLSECILLRILSWDTPMLTVGCAIDDDAGGGDTTTTTMIRAPFWRAVKVIFAEASDEHVLRRTSASGGDDGLMEWT